jgi:hypothetical protein
MQIAECKVQIDGPGREDEAGGEKLEARSQRDRLKSEGKKGEARMRAKLEARS